MMAVNIIDHDTYLHQGIQNDGASSILGPTTQLFARAASTDGEASLGQFGLEGALRFFDGALEEGLPPREYDLDPEAASVVQVWTDAMWEPSQREPARVAFCGTLSSRGGRREG